MEAAEANDGQLLQNARRIVIKLGSGIVVNEDGDVAAERLRSILRGCVPLWRRGAEVLLVSSGAVGLGRRMLGDPQDQSTRARQAYAAIGQARLVEIYRDLLAAHDRHVAQMLLTSQNFTSREQFLNARDTLEKLLEIGVVPLINENDTVSTAELATGSSQSFGDNDVLSALVAAKTAADLLVILTDVDGIYDRNPMTDAAARRLPVVPDLAALAEVETAGTSTLGRGGMRSKLEAARIAAISGVTTWVTSGVADDALAWLANPERAGGTVVLPQGRLRQKKQWIAFSSGYRGTVTINAGAERALIGKRSSLLPVGISKVEGVFGRGETVRVVGDSGVELGRGVAEMSAADLRRVVGLRSEAVENELGFGRETRFVHRDQLVMFDGLQPQRDSDAGTS